MLEMVQQTQSTAQLALPLSNERSVRDYGETVLLVLTFFTPKYFCKTYQLHQEDMQLDDETLKTYSRIIKPGRHEKHQYVTELHSTTGRTVLPFSVSTCAIATFGVHPP